MNNISRDLFVKKPMSTEEHDVIASESLTFFQDAGRRLRKNKISMISIYAILILVIFAIVGPLMTGHRYDRNVQDATKMEAKQLPPRIPGLEKIGIFDGTVTKSVSVASLGSDDYPEGSYEVVGEPFEYRGMQQQKIKENLYVKNGIEDNYYWFGTDELSRDIWTRLWYGVRVSLFIGLFAAFVDTTVGLLVGLTSGFYGGKVDLVLMRIVEVVSEIPALVILVLLILVLKPGLLTLSIAIGLTGWTGVARVVRSHVFRLREQEFILASRTLGADSKRLITKHIFPNIIGQIVIMATFSIPSAIFYEAFLSLIGLGLPAPMASLGTLINTGRNFIDTAPHMIVVPSLIMSALMLAINMLSNGLRDALDPRLRSR